ncbi:MAG: HNH endonuclease, partial [Solirubrobacteraceae bacterium]
MIRRCFLEPNFRCAATEENGVRRVWLTHGESATDIEQRLTDNGWIVHAIKPYDFEKWRVRSRALLATVHADLADGREPNFNENHWKKLKMHLFELFDGKCAYCEAKPGHVTVGHVEHYRPKGNVKDDENHGGYYWLAFEASNLLPACPACNSAHGKGDRFPVVAGTRATSPAE